VKYREFWIRTEPEFDHITKHEEDAGFNHIHVIDYAAYAEAIKMLEEMSEELRINRADLELLKINRCCIGLNITHVESYVMSLDEKTVIDGAIHRAKDILESK